MKRNSFLIIPVIILSFAVCIHAQKKTRYGKVCGNPSLPCKSRDNFQPYELPFDTGKNSVISDSEFFYAIVLKSAKPTTEINCDKPFPESERLEIQEMFRDHKVFTWRCDEAGSSYYTGVKTGTPFIGVYAGKTLAEANKFLQNVQATKKFPGVRVRRMRTGINGT